MSSPELDRVFWQDDGWSRLSAHFTGKKGGQLAPTRPSSQIESMKRSLERSPKSTSSVSTSGSSNSIQMGRRRKRARMSSHDEQSTSIEMANSRAMSERITELARRLSVAAMTPPLQDRTNAERTVLGPVKAVANPGIQQKVIGKRAMDYKDRTKPGGTRTSPLKPPRPFVKTYSGPVGVSVSPAASWRSEPQKSPSDDAGHLGGKPELPIDLTQDDDGFEADDSFDLLLSQMPNLEAVLDSVSPSSPRKGPSPVARRSPRLKQQKGAVTLSQEAAAKLCAGINDWSDLEDL